MHTKWIGATINKKNKKDKQSYDIKKTAYADKMMARQDEATKYFDLPL